MTAEDKEDDTSEMPYWLVEDCDYKKPGLVKHWSPKYDGWFHLLKKGTYIHAGWMVCSYTELKISNRGGERLCPVESGPQKYNPSGGGTNGLSDHMARHSAESARNEADTRKNWAVFGAESKVDSLMPALDFSSMICGRFLWWRAKDS